MKFRSRLAAAIASAAPLAALAEGTTKIDTGDTAWTITAAALVLLMTPGLAFFYGGMVKSKNVVSTLFQSFSAFAVVGVLWAVFGYSLSFAKGNGFIGSFDWAFLNGVGEDANADYGATIPHVAFMLFQCMFAIITPALFTGAFAERVKFKAWLLVCALWATAVYFPVAHWVWGVGGWVRELGALDFAGGLVVHMTAGFSAIALAMVIGRRRDAHAAFTPHDQGYVGIGTGLLIFGWLGFNGGSALGANGIAAQAASTTLFSCCAAMAAWMMIDTFLRGKATFMGACIAAVVGLVAVTPAAGFVTIPSALAIGAIAGGVVNVAIPLIKKALPFDDALDVFACHGLGGTIGTVLTGVFATKAVNSAGADGLLSGDFGVLKANVIGGGAVIAYSLVATFVIAKVVDVVVGLRVSEQDERVGLDASQHGEIVNAQFTPTETATPSNVTELKRAG